MVKVHFFKKGLLLPLFVGLGLQSLVAGGNIEIEDTATAVVEEYKLRAYPSVSLGAQPAFGLNSGQGVVSVGGIDGTASSSRVSGAALAGFGFLDSKESVGLQVDVVLASINPTDGGFADAGFFNFKLHKMLDDLSSVAIGVEAVSPWGDADDVDSSSYASYTKIFLLPQPLIVSAGVGDGRFVADNNDDYDFFASVGYHITPRVGVLADYTAEITRLGVSFVPFEAYPINVTLYANDITEHEDSTKFAGNISYIFNF